MIFISLITEHLHAQAGLDTLSRRDISFRYGISADYLVPTRFNNQITTTSLHATFWKKRFIQNYVLLNAGLTFTYGWGNSQQFKSVSDTVIEIDTYNTAAFGLGPIIQLEPTIIKLKNFALTGEASGGVILYNKRFPYGGDIYNFMFRMGPSLAFKVCRNCWVKAGYRWMHVSNGKGFGNQNPFYEAQGVSIGFVKVL